MGRGMEARIFFFSILVWVEVPGWGESEGQPLLLLLIGVGGGSGDREGVEASLFFPQS